MGQQNQKMLTLRGIPLGSLDARYPKKKTQFSKEKQPARCSASESYGTLRLEPHAPQQYFGLPFPDTTIIYNHLQFFSAGAHIFRTAPLGGTMEYLSHLDQVLSPSNIWNFPRNHSDGVPEFSSGPTNPFKSNISWLKTILKNRNAECSWIVHGFPIIVDGLPICFHPFFQWVFLLKRQRYHPGAVHGRCLWQTLAIQRVHMAMWGQKWNDHGGNVGITMINHPCLMTGRWFIIVIPTL